MKIQSAVVGACVVLLIVVIGWAVSDEMRPYKNTVGELNTSIVGSKFGSVGQGGIRRYKMIVEEVSPGGFVGVRFVLDRQGDHYGAINPIDGVPDIAVGDLVWVEDRVYVSSNMVGNSESKMIRLITKKVE